MASNEWGRILNKNDPFTGTGYETFSSNMAHGRGHIVQYGPNVWCAEGGTGHRYPKAAVIPSSPPTIAFIY